MATQYNIFKISFQQLILLIKPSSSLYESKLTSKNDLHTAINNIKLSSMDVRFKWDELYQILLFHCILVYYECVLFNLVLSYQNPIIENCFNSLFIFIESWDKFLFSNGFIKPMVVQNKIRYMFITTNSASRSLSHLIKQGASCFNFLDEEEEFVVSEQAKDFFSLKLLDELKIKSQKRIAEVPCTRKEQQKIKKILALVIPSIVTLK